MLYGSHKSSIVDITSESSEALRIDSGSRDALLNAEYHFLV